MRTDVAELVDKSATADHCEIIDHNLAGTLYGIRHDYVVTDHTVVGHMAVGHDQAVAAYHGLALGGCAAVDGHTLTDSGVVTDNGYRFLAAELQVLWRTGDNRAGIDCTILADACAFHDGNVRTDTSTFTDLDILINSDKRIYHYTRMDLRCRMDICQRLFHSYFIERNSVFT